MTDIIMFLISGVALPVAGWALKSNMNLRERVAVLEAKLGGFEDWLTKIESKLDRVIEGK